MPAEILYISLLVLAGLLGVAGIVGCIFPYPGHLCLLGAAGCVSYAHPEREDTLWVWIALIVLTVAGVLIDNVTSYFGAKKFGASKASLYCCLAGVFIGSFFFPLGLILGPLIGAFVGEFLITKRGVKQASKSAIGGLLGFLIGVMGKLFIAGIMLVLILELGGLY